ncbi:hypothetical protein QJU23_08540 [Pasteurella atlantica]|uniref:Uncharacterized protein n=2 Tax=Pasteurellaceae TaxID=712 RepID=A0ACC6HNR6_9PAST|nr:hypothetical protein [Pasteurella atlantica]MDP8052468.1 hypothetical protein [Pasteurella atlantica]MDP8105747.1 hypothetical protein [Pasteurella atlantica]MDP8149179.1 hypothetical protein [Pasteurella atlantica]
MVKKKLGLFFLVCVIALVLSLSYGEKTISNDNLKTWFELLAEDETSLQGDNLTGNLEEILQLSIQVIKTGTTTLEELKSLGNYHPIHPKFGSLYIFRFNTPQTCQ